MFRTTLGHGVAIRRTLCSGLLLSLVAATGVGAQDTPPIFKPGAPGKPTTILTPAESLALGSSRYTNADVGFMQMMIIHHAQAVEMGSLIKARTEHKGIRLMGERIAISQASEIEMMRTWLRRRGEAIEMRDGEHHHFGGHTMSSGDDPDVPLMTGMLSANQMKRLAASSNADFDRLFLTGMILHHQGALDMVSGLMTEEGAGEDTELSEFLASIVADQSTEILRMQNMLSDAQQQ